MKRVAVFSVILAATAYCTVANGESTPIGMRPTSVRAVDGKYISWREHIIDDSAIGGVAISGSDGMVMADLDRDGHEDVVSVHESDTHYGDAPEGHVRIAFGSADPDSWTNVTLAEGAEAAAAEDVTIGDVNGDGYLDVMVACELAHLIYFQNPGAEARTARWPRLILPVTQGRGSFIRVHLADYDGDGRPEASAPNKGVHRPRLDTKETHAVSIYQSVGDPLVGDSWREHVLGRFRIPHNAQPIDIDEDGDLDVAVGSRGEGRILWFENLGGGKLEFRQHDIRPETGPGGGFRFAAADLSGDDRLDLVTGVGRGLGWMEQPASGDEWEMHRIGTFMPDSMTGFALADIDGDGDLDVMAGSYSKGPRDDDGDVTLEDELGRLGWFEQPDDPSRPWPRHDVSRRKRGMFDELVARDMDGDGDVDFVGTRGNSAPWDGVFWLEQVRSEAPRPAFERARPTDSAEVSLPESAQ